MTLDHYVSQPNLPYRFNSTLIELNEGNHEHHAKHWGERAGFKKSIVSALEPFRQAGISSIQKQKRGIRYPFAALQSLCCNAGRRGKKPSVLVTLTFFKN